MQTQENAREQFWKKAKKKRMIIEEMFVLTQASFSKNFWLPNENRAHDLLITGQTRYPLSYKNSRRERVT